MSAEREPSNPFNEGAAGKYFVGRDDELKRFTRALTALRGAEATHLFVAGVNGRGKTSYLEKLVEIARQEGMFAVRVSLDPGVSAHQQILAMFDSLVDRADDVLEEKLGTRPLTMQWSAREGSPFRLPRSERLQNGHVLRDLAHVARVVTGPETGYRHLVICVDEGERVEPYALSALKNALLELKQYLVVLSVRLPEDLGDPVRTGKLKLEEIATAAGRDLGAARIFGNGVGLGSFTGAQARACVTRRLEDNAIQFEDEVTDLVARVSRYLPYQIVSYAREVYDRTEAAGARTATTGIFREVFTGMHRLELDEAKALAAQSTSADRRKLRELARQDVPLTPMELARKLHPETSEDVLESVADSFRGLLDRMGDTLCTQEEGRYWVRDPVRRYALEIAMEPE